MDDKCQGPERRPSSPPPRKPPKKRPPQSPQSAVSTFWNQFNSERPGKVFRILPHNFHARQKAARSAAHGRVPSQKAYKSYDEAKDECIRDVNRIIRECKRVNQKYRDPHFDIEKDLKTHERMCLDGLEGNPNEMKPKGVKRVKDIFEKPEFYINGPSAGDVRQGRDGDCYLMAALCGLGSMEGLIERVCVKHDDECRDVGVYGFVFHRDGEWQQTIIDDQLYLRQPDYDEAQDERRVWDDINRVDPQAEYRKTHQMGSRALYFAQCSDENETWLPLLEKAYAKAHGDFAAIDGGFVGEAVEDLTGGVTTEIYNTDIMDKEAFWHDQLMQVGKQFLFGCATGLYSDWLDESGKERVRERQGITEGHAYSIMDAREIRGQRLLKVRNPWGKKEWNGRWSDGSAEWDAEWMELLEHKFGNDGIFWISYEDLLMKYQHFDRTRIFGPEWSVSQCWASVDVPWAEEYLATKFLLTLKEQAKVVIVLSQLDDHYFKGLEGPYSFELQFRLEDLDNDNPNDYIVRANEACAMKRSVSTDIELGAGTYLVLMKITATRESDHPGIEKILPVYAEESREKLIQIGLSYDLAHAKGIYVESPEERKNREAKAKQIRTRQRNKAKKKFRKNAEKRWRRNKMRHDRETMERARQREDGEGSGSLDVHGTSSSKGTEPKGQQDWQKDNADRELPLRIQPVSGETSGMPGAAPLNEHVVQAGAEIPPETRDAEIASSDLGAARANTANPVQSLEQVIHPPEVEVNEGGLPPTLAVAIDGQKVVTNVTPLQSLPPKSVPEHIDSGLPANGAAANGTIKPMAPVSKDSGEDGKSDFFTPLNWDSDLDYPSEFDSTSSSSADSDSERSTSSDEDRILYRPPSQPRKARFNPIHPARERSPEQRSGDNNRKDTRRDEGGPDNPWNAVCVVGLRVYSTIEGGVDLKVLWPEYEDRKLSKKNRKLTDPIEEKLDPDDQAKGAVTAATVLTTCDKDHDQRST